MIRAGYKHLRNPFALLGPMYLHRVIFRCVIGQFARKARLPAHIEWPQMQPTCVLNRIRGFIRHLQVATAGEDEEDQWVVDGQQRTARRDDEHGCALNTAGSAVLWFGWRKKRKEEKGGWGVNKYPLSLIREWIAAVPSFSLRPMRVGVLSKWSRGALRQLQAPLSMCWRQEASSLVRSVCVLSHLG